MKDQGVTATEVCPNLSKPPSGKSLMSQKGKEERETAWQAMGFAAADKPSSCLECWGCWRDKQCFEVSKWERKKAATLKDNRASSLFLARVRASATSTSQIAEESMSQDSLPSVNNSLSPPSQRRKQRPRELFFMWTPSLLALL